MLFAGLAAVASPVATDLDVPFEMDAGGTEEAPAVYLIGESGPVSHDLGEEGANIGTFESYNHLVVRSGSTLTNTGYGGSIGWAGSHNQVTVTDAGSSWINAGTNGFLSVGWNGSYNRLVIKNGGYVSNTRSVDVGLGTASTHNSVVVSGAGSKWVTDPIAVSGGGYNSLIVENGGRIETDLGHSRIGRYAESINNQVHVSGAGSAWLNTGGLIITESTGNTVTIDNGGLITVNGGHGFLVGTEMDNFVRLNGGFLAVSGDRVALFDGLIDAGVFQFWNGMGWETGEASDFGFGYHASETSAFELTGHEDLAGYTIITNPYVAPIPEPAVFSLLLGGGVFTLAALRRRPRG